MIYDLSAKDVVPPPRRPLARFAAGLTVTLGWIAAAAGFAALGFAVALADEPRPIVAIVIDDVGLDPAAAERAIALPAPVTISLLSYAPGARALDRAARAAGHETFVHLPMEPMGLADPGPGGLASWMSVAEIARRAAIAFDAAPGATGFNNHMGSRFTQCARCLAPVLDEARMRGLIALDSVTDPRSVLADVAARSGLRSLGRDVFLDDARDGPAIARRLAEAEAVARSRGWAVAIGHPHDETLSALEAWIPEARARGVEIAPAGAALARREGAERPPS